MINLPLLLTLQESGFEVEGGLFDFDATLPLMAIQFIILAALLNALLYKPLGKAIDERGSYVQGKFAQAKEPQRK